MEHLLFNLKWVTAIQRLCYIELCVWNLDAFRELPKFKGEKNIIYIYIYIYVYMYRFPPPHKLRIKIILANGKKTIRNKKKKKKGWNSEIENKS